MANFPSFTFTTAGRAAITRSLSGKDVDQLIITKCVLGDGVYSDGIETLKDVTSPKMTVTVSEYTDNGDGTSVTRFVYDNASLDVGFSHREMGIYAKNGYSGTELLLCYSNAGDQYSYIRAGTVDSVTKQRKATIPPQTFKFVLATGGSGSVNAVIDPKGYVDVEMLKKHNADTTAHQPILDLINTNKTALNNHNTDTTAHPDIRKNLNTYIRLQSGGVIFDANGTSVNKISVGDSPMNYNGSGYSYLFKDGKGNLADIYADEYYGTFRGKAMAGGITLTADLNTPYVDTYSKKLEVTDSGTANNLPFKWNFITTLKSNTDIAQLAIPVDSKARISLRCMSNQGNNTLNGTWLEIPYLKDIQPIAAAEVAKIVNSAPATLDTLSELANALGNDPNFATTVATQIGQKADKTELNSKLASHNTDETAHDNRFKLFEKISDLGNDIINKLALTTAITAITALETNSWFGQLLKMVLNASGVKYSMAKNGYICLGGFFGGLIIQWINNTGSSGWVVVNYPIAMTEIYAVIPVTISNGHADRSNLFKYYPLVSTYNTASSECWLEGNNQFVLVIGR